MCVRIYTKDGTTILYNFVVENKLINTSFYQLSNNNSNIIYIYLYYYWLFLLQPNNCQRLFF